MTITARPRRNSVIGRFSKRTQLRVERVDISSVSTMCTLWEPHAQLKRRVKAGGDKIILVADDGGKSWDVVNPETLEDHVGHHVELNAHGYEDKGQIHVMKVKML